MTDIIERLLLAPQADFYKPSKWFELMGAAAAEIKRLIGIINCLEGLRQCDQVEIAQLRAALEPFARNVEAVSLSATLGHITREHLWTARRALEPKP